MARELVKMLTTEVLDIEAYESDDLVILTAQTPQIGSVSLQISLAEFWRFASRVHRVQVQLGARQSDLDDTAREAD